MQELNNSFDIRNFFFLDAGVNECIWGLFEIECVYKKLIYMHMMMKWYTMRIKTLADQ